MLQFAKTAISVSVYVFVFSLQKMQFPFAIRTWTSLNTNLWFITVFSCSVERISCIEQHIQMENNSKKQKFC